MLRSILRLKRLWVAGVLLLLLFIGSCGQDDAKGYYDVLKVIDGDTFYVLDEQDHEIRVRLIGVDAPESRNAFKKKIGYYGKEAKQFLTRTLKGERVKLEYDVARQDRYGRTLAYAYLEDGTFLNAMLVEEGYAMVMTVPPNVKHAELFLEKQQEAREEGRGLWNKP